MRESFLYENAAENFRQKSENELIEIIKENLKRDYDDSWQPEKFVFSQKVENLKNSCEILQRDEVTKGVLRSFLS